VTDAVRYEAIGAGYATTRREDPVLRARIHAALGDAGTVVNVGAGVSPLSPPQATIPNPARAASA